jgi:WD40 repeat protein
MLKLQGHRRKVLALTFAPDGRRLVSVAPRERRVSLWELPGGTRTLSPESDEEVQALAFAPDGSAVVLASGPFLHRWDLADNALEQDWRQGSEHCWQVAFSPDGALLAAFCHARWGNTNRISVDLFRMDKRGKKRSLTPDYGWPVDLKFSPSGRLLAAVSNSVRVWNMKAKARAVSLQFAGNKHAVAFSADETQVVLSAGKKLTLYDLATRKPCGQLTGHTGYVIALAVSPDGTLLSAADDGTARLWDIGTRRERACFDWKLGRLRAAAFSPDGTLAAVGGEDGIVVCDVE